MGIVNPKNKPDVRKLCKQDLDRAATMTRHAIERMGWLVDHYADYPQFADLLKITCVNLDGCLDSIKTLRANIP